MKRLLIISSSRADIGGLSAVWRRTAQEPSLETHVLLTGRHVLRAEDHAAAMAVMPEGVSVHVAGTDIGGRDALTVAQAMGESTGAVASVIARTEPDIALVLGDRLDMMPAALACVPFGLPLAHINGGELTLGAVDDVLRHAVTKLSHLHFVTGTDAARRVAAMGEEAWRIHATGAPGLDSLAAQPQASRADFLAEVGLPDAPFALVTVHSETNSPAPLAAFHAVEAALQKLAMPVLVTAANADMHGADINAAMMAVAARDPRVRFHDTLGARRYANALRHAAVMIGNSSSGVIEAGLFGLPVVDIGARQEGRPRGRNVATVGADAEAVHEAARALIGQRFDPAEVSLYGDGKAVARIVSVLADLPSRERLLRKDFSEAAPDVQAPWAKHPSLEDTAP